MSERSHQTSQLSLESGAGYLFAGNSDSRFKKTGYALNDRSLKTEVKPKANAVVVDFSEVSVRQ